MLDVRKLLPAYCLIGFSMVAMLGGIVGCASQAFQSDVAATTGSVRYLTQEARYQSDAKDLVAFHKDHPTDDVSDLVAADAAAYDAVAKARVDNYAAADLDAIDAVLTRYEAFLNQKGIKGYVARTAGAH